MATEDSINVTVYGKGGHGAIPQHTIDPVVLAAMAIVRLQTIVSREVAPGEIAVVTVGSVQAGTRSNLIPDHALLELNLRSYSEQTHERMLASVQRIVRAESQASGSPRTRTSTPWAASRSPSTTRPRRNGRRPPSPPTSATTPVKSTGRPSARTSQHSQRRRGALHLLGARVHRREDLRAAGEGRAPAGSDLQPLTEIPAAAAALPADRHRGPDHSRAGVVGADMKVPRRRMDPGWALESMALPARRRRGRPPGRRRGDGLPGRGELLQVSAHGR